MATNTPVSDEHAHPGEHPHDHGDDHYHEHKPGHTDTGHGHSHAQIDPELFASEKGIRVLKASLVILGLTAAFEAVVVWIGGSAGLLADMLHNFADMFTAVPLWIAFALARRQGNRRFTYGYNRAEDVAGVIILLVVAGTAAIAAYESYQKMISGAVPIHLGWGILAGVVGFLGNERVAQYRIRVGKEIGSAALVAYGQHGRIVGLTSLAAVAGLVGVWLGFPLADPLAGFVITLAILGIVWDVGRSILGRLMDAIEPETVDQIEQITAGVPGVEQFHNVRARWVGHQVYIELHINVDPGLTVAQGHQIAEEVRHQLLHQIPRLTNVLVHVDPCDHDGRDYHAITQHHFVKEKSESRRPCA